MDNDTRRGGVCGWLAVAASVLMGGGWMAGTATAALQTSVSPTNVVWTSNTWVTVTVSNLTAGADVKLGLYLDVQGNGVVDALDPLLAAYRVQDGRTNWLGASIIVDDDDATANGKTVSRVAYFGQQGIFHGIGTYLWLAKTVSGGTTTVARFTVTQPTSTVWIAGTVADYVTSNAVGGAAVIIERFTHGPSPLVWTGTDGAFKLYLPPGVSTADVSRISAVGLGYFNPETGPEGVEPVSSYVYTNDLRTGVNPLPGPLRVVPKIPGEIFEVSGHVYDPRTNAIPGILVNIEWEGEDDDDEGWAVAVTDTNGVYRLCVPEIAEADLYTDPDSMTRLGLVAVGRQVAVSGDMTGADLFCPAATLLARGKVLAADNGAPVAGATISADGDMFGSQGVSVSDGSCEIPVIPYDNYTVDVDDVSEWGFMRVPGYDGLSITNNSMTNLDFRVLRTYPVTGTVYDTQTNRTTGGTVGAFRYRHVKFWEWEVDTGINRHGDFRLLAPTGSLVVVVVQVPGCDGVVYRDHAYAEWDNNHEAELVTNTPAGASGVNFYLLRTARIEGTVRGGGAPLAGMPVMISERVGNDWQWRSMDDTDANGFYSIEVAPGTNYGVKVGSEVEVGLWLGQAYDHVPDLSEATRVTTAVDAPATNINFDLELGGLICGRVFEADGVTPVVDCPVNVMTTDGNFEDDNNSDDDGYFAIVVPPGTYRVEARPDWQGLPFVRQYFSNVTSEAEAMELDMVSGGVRSNVDFRLSQACRIAGYVFRDDGTTPLVNCHVNASDYDSNDWMAGNNTDDDGRYTLWLPPGTYRVRAVPAEEGLLFESKFYDDTYRYDDAEPVTIGEGSDRDGVNFTLAPAGTISGHIRVGTTPLEDCHIGAEDYTTGEWMAWDNTESDGSYQLVLPAGTYRVVARPSNDDLPYMDAYYDDVFAWEDAEPVVVNDADDTPGIDFQLQPGGTLSGHVYQEDGVTPVANCRVCADDPDTGQWRAEDQTEDDGAYSLRLPAGSYVVRAKPTQDNLPFADQHYSNAADRADATLVTVVVSNDTPNIDFMLTSGCTISGHIYREDGMTPLPDCHVFANDYDSNEGMAGANTDDEGRYTLRLPAGTYRVRAYPAANGLLYESRFYPNTYYYGGAVPVAVDESNNAEGIDFVLARAGTISGYVYAGTGTTAVANCHIGAEEAMSGEWMGWDNTASDGSYQLVLPEGTYRVVARPSNSGLPYMDYYYLATPTSDEAEPVAVNGVDDTSGIDIHLSAGCLISGYVRTDDGARPLANCHVNAADYHNWAWMAGRNTDSAGYYWLRVPTGGTYRIQAVPSNDGLPYVDEWYLDTTDWMAAQAVEVGVAAELDGVDFSLMLGDLPYYSWQSHYFSEAELEDDDTAGDDADPDHDGASNGEEYTADTNPRDSNSVLRVTGTGWSGDAMRIEWKGGRWAPQYIQRSPTLDAPDDAWEYIHYTYSLPTVVSNSCLDPQEAPSTFFYRVKAERW